MTERAAQGGTLVVGGGFAGGYVAAALAKAPRRRGLDRSAVVPPDIAELGTLGHPQRLD